MYNQIVIEKVDNGYIIAIQGKIKTKGMGLFSLGNVRQENKIYLVAKTKKEVTQTIAEHLTNLITNKESMELLEKESSTYEDDEEDEDENEDNS